MSGIRRAGLTDLVSELERQKASSKDLVAPSESIVAQPRGEHIVLEVNGYGEYPLNEYAHKQLAQKMGIPQTYYDRMRSARKTELLSRNINEWMGAKEKRLLRILDGNVRAILSDRYRPIDNYDLIWSFLEVSKEAKDDGVPIEISHADITETHLYLRAMLPTYANIVAKKGEEDKAQAMILLQNSEVGAGRMSVALGMYRLVCSNGMWGDDIVSRVHLGAQLDAGVVEWSEKTLRDTDVALFDQVQDTMRTALDSSLWESFVAKTTASTRNAIEVPLVEVVEDVAPRFKMSDAEKGSLLEAFAQEIATPAGKTQWGLANAITRVARDSSDADRQVELERIGGEVAMAPASKYSYLIKAER